MQRVLTLELRVDYRDKEKLDLMKDIMADAARRVYAASAILSDNIKPQVAIFSDDFFQTHEELSMEEGSKSDSTFCVEGCVEGYSHSQATKSVGESGGEEISPELLAAIR